MKSIKKCLYLFATICLILICLKLFHDSEIKKFCLLCNQISLGQTLDEVVRTTINHSASSRIVLYMKDKSIGEKLIIVEKRSFLFFKSYMLFINFKDGIVSAYAIRTSDDLTRKPTFAPKDVLSSSGNYKLLKNVCCVKSKKS